VDRYLAQLGVDDAPDRRNGYYPRHLLTTLGDIELPVPRTRRYSPVSVLRAYARREAEIDRVMLAGFVLELSTRKVGETLLAIFGQRVSATTVSACAKRILQSQDFSNLPHRCSLGGHWTSIAWLQRRTSSGDSLAERESTSATLRRWPASIGMGGRLASESVAGLARITQIIHLSGQFCRSDLQSARLGSAVAELERRLYRQLSKVAMQMSFAMPRLNVENSSGQCMYSPAIW
jgi:hypothetical protein